MIKQLLLLGSVTVLIASFTFSKKKEFIPPGTVKINDTLYADETEVSNLSWREYEIWTRQKYGYHSKEHIAALPDTLVWRDKHSYNEPYVEHYYRHPAYNNYPVVGISYEQACAYTEWRMERIKEFMCISGKYRIVDFTYRLPNKKEWEFLSNNGVECFSNNGKNEKGKIKFNHRWAGDENELKNGDLNTFPDVTAPVFSYQPNRFKLWNMIGNVSEMVQEKGVSKGGGWPHLLEECRVGKDIAYNKPSSWLGFRCVCVVKAPKI